MRDGKNLRRLALGLKIPIITTVAGARATTEALRGLKSGPLTQTPLQVRLPVLQPAMSSRCCRSKIPLLQDSEITRACNA